MRPSNMKQTLAFIVALVFSINLQANETLEQYFLFNGYNLEETELSSIIKQLGDAPIHKEGDAHDSYTGICYQDPNANVTVYFESGEMGGGKTLLSYKVTQGMNSDFPCYKLPTDMHLNYSIGNLKLGSRLETTIQSLPKKTYSREDLLFWYINKIPFTNEDILRTGVENMKYAFWNQTVTIELFSEEKIISGYRVYKVTSW